MGALKKGKLGLQRALATNTQPAAVAQWQKALRLIGSIPGHRDVLVVQRPKEITAVSRQDFIPRSRIPGSLNSFVSLIHRAPRNPGVACARKTPIPH